MAIIFSVGTNDVAVTDSENPTTNFIALNPAGASFFEKGINAGTGSFYVDDQGNTVARSLGLLTLNEEQIAAVPVNSLYFDGTNLFFKKSSGSFNITG